MCYSIPACALVLLTLSMLWLIRTVSIPIGLCLDVLHPSIPPEALLGVFGSWKLTVIIRLISLWLRLSYEYFGKGNLVAEGKSLAV